MSTTIEAGAMTGPEVVVDSTGNEAIAMMSPSTHTDDAATIVHDGKNVTPETIRDALATPTTKTVRTPSSKSKSSSKPSYLDMVVSVIRELRGRNGSSLAAIRKALAQNYFNGDVDAISKVALSKTLKAAVSKGKLVRPLEHNSYKVNAEYLKEVKAKQATEKRKKSKANKATTKANTKQDKKPKAVLTQSAIKKKIDRERREQMLKERERKLLKNKMEDMALIKQDKELGIKVQAPRQPILDTYLKLFPYTLMDTTSSLTKLSNRAKQARLHAFDCINVSARCWDILYGAGNLNRLLGSQTSLESVDDDNDDTTVSTIDSIKQLPMFTFENLVHTFVQCTQNDVSDPPSSLWVLLDWCLEHLINKGDELAHIPRSPSTMIHIAKLYVMNRLHNIRSAFRHDHEQHVDDDNDDDERSQVADEASQSQTEDDGDESMNLQMSVDDDDVGDSSNSELNILLDDMFPADGCPKYHNILLFLCDDLLTLPQVADDLAKRDASRNDLMRRLKSADVALRRVTSQWRLQQAGTSCSKITSTSNSSAGDPGADNKKDIGGTNRQEKTGKAAKEKGPTRPITKKECDAAQATYDELVKVRFDSEYNCRTVVLGQDRHFKTYYLLPGQGILILNGDRNPEAPKYEASMIKDPNDVQLLVACLDQRGQRESALLQNLTMYGGVSRWLPKQRLSPVESRIAELRGNLETTSSIRVQGSIMAEISQLEKKLIPTADDLSGVSSMSSSLKKSMRAEDLFSVSCKILSGLCKRVSDVIGDEQLSVEVSTKIKSAKDATETNMKAAWRQLIICMQQVQSVLYRSSLIQLSHEHNEHKPKLEKYATLLNKLTHTSISATSLIRQLLIDAISDLKHRIVDNNNDTMDVDVESQAESSMDDASEVKNDLAKLTSLLSDCRAALKSWRETSANATHSAICAVVEKYDIYDVTASLDNNVDTDGDSEEREGKTVFDSRVIFDAFKKPEVWRSYLDEKCEVAPTSFCHCAMLATTIHAFVDLADDLIDEMQDGRSSLENILAQYKRHGSKRKTRGSNASTESDDLPSLVTECNGEDALWCQCESTEDFLLCKGVMPEPSLYWPVRVMDVSDGDLARELVQLGLRAVVVMHCGVKSLTVQLVPTHFCRPITDRIEYEKEMSSDKGIVDTKSIKIWKESVKICFKLGYCFDYNCFVEEKKMG